MSMSVLPQKRYFILSLLTVMAAFLPTLYSGTIAIDDLELIDSLASLYQCSDLKGLFIRNKPTVYYRPLLALINLIDYSIWKETIAGYHLTNYLFHIANSVLLYRISYYIFRNTNNPSQYASISMLIFALNPLTIESVAWISGRSDIFGTFFSLIAVNCYILQNKFRYILTPFFVLTGLLCKENAFAIIPVIIIFDMVLNVKDSDLFSEKRSIHYEKILEIVKTFTLWSLTLISPIVVYVILRTAGGGGFENDTARITHAATSSFDNFGFGFYGYFKVFPAIAFYLKKILIPFPLNFSIKSINYELYSILFIALLTINVMWIKKKKYDYLIIIILLICSFSPALPVAIGNIAWVSFAERYLYLSLCIWGISFSYIIIDCIKTGLLKEVIIKYGVCFLLIICLVTSVKREFDWHKYEKVLFQAAGKTDPENYKAIFHYAVSHNNKSRIKDLRKAEKYAVKASDERFLAKIYRHMAYYYSEYNLPENYLRIPEVEYETVGEDKDYIHKKMSEQEIYGEVIENLDNSIELHPNYESYDFAARIILKLQPEDDVLKTNVFKKAKIYYKEAYKKRPNAFMMYRIGGLEKLLNNNKKAAGSFRLVIEKFPDSEYAVYSKTRLRKLKENGLIE